MTIPKLPRAELNRVYYTGKSLPIDLMEQEDWRYQYASCNLCLEFTVWHVSDLQHKPLGYLVANLKICPLPHLCHCGKPIHVYEDGFTRYLCFTCSDERCDAPQEGVVYSCQK